MVLRLSSFFDEKPFQLNDSINPYLKIFQENRLDRNLPLFFGQDLKGAKGHWRSLLGLKAQDSLVLEIGCHKGLTLSHMAKDHPQIGFLGIDITFKRVVISAQRIKPYHHAGVIYGRAENLEEIFLQEELSGLVMFFPDPWSKKPSQKHHRLLDENFGKLIKSLLRKNGFFWFKTDDLSYFEEAQKICASQGFLEGNPPFSQPYESTFERKFRQKQTLHYVSTWYK